MTNQFSRFFENSKYLFTFCVFFSQQSTPPGPIMSTSETATCSSENSEKFSSTNSSSSADASKEATPSEGSRTESSSRDNKREASWPSVLFYIHLNILGVYGIFVLFSHTSAITFIFSKCVGWMQNMGEINLIIICFAASFLTLFGILGATAGAHRLWAHKTYQASTFLRFSLMLCQTLAGQVSV